MRSRHHIARTMAALSAALFSLLSLIRFGDPSFGIFDSVLSGWIMTSRTEGITGVTVFLTETLSSPLIAALIIGLGAILWAGRRKFLATLLLVSAAFGVFLFSILKIIFAAARPEAGLVHESTWSYPSGHATIATILFLFLAVLFKHAVRRKIPAFLFYLTTLCMIMAVGLSRIYLGVHWPSDVLGGFFLGVFSISVAYMLLAAHFTHHFITRHDSTNS